MPLLRLPLLLLALVSLSAMAADGFWQGTLNDGSRVTIDPTTNKASRTLQGQTTPLWNGVHRLTNGAVIIVRDGVVVPDQGILEAQREQTQNRFSQACMQLVTKVCGPHDECRANPACDPARQLMTLQRDELNNNLSGATLESSRLCLEALGNEDYFSPCNRNESALSKTTCERLAVRVCGEAGGCEGTQSCQAVRQLITMERRDHVDAPGSPSQATSQCREVLGQSNDYFLACPAKPE